MIKIVVCHDDGRGSCSTLENLDLKSDKVIWIDSQNPTQEERERIAKALDLDMDEIIDSLDEEEHARVEVEDGYTSIIYTAPVLDDGEMETSSFGIFIKENIILTLRRFDVRSLELFERTIMRSKNGFRNKLIENRYFFIKTMFDFVNKDYLKILNVIDERIEELNDEIFHDPKEGQMQEVLKHKKTLVYFSRGLLAVREVLVLIKRGYLPDMKDKDVENFIDLYSDTLQLIDMNTTYKELINTSMNLYHSSVSNAMNVTMKKLTLLAVIFVVPTLISGIYGMNFSWMPLLDDPFGFFYSIAFMILLIVVLIGYLWKKQL